MNDARVTVEGTDRASAAVIDEALLVTRTDSSCSSGNGSGSG